MGGPLPVDRGLSPRVRGNHVEEPRFLVPVGSIPACAGEPLATGGDDAGVGVYPRVCGGTHVAGVRRQPAHLGSIPACAGEPSASAPKADEDGVYPRVCGGTATARSVRGSSDGLSPRVRGNPGRPRRDCLGRGSIPACAGEPASASWVSAAASVYPRVCGGTWPSASAPTRCRGLSPRVRGNRSARDSRASRTRSIPACAGEPYGSTAYRRTNGVYPRVWGGTPAIGARGYALDGLSPRGGGNLVDEPALRVLDGSIPACAGEPPWVDARPEPHTVYPRVCGGTLARATCACCFAGLSPRVRGNRPGLMRGPSPTRSIPACAGEPSRSVRLSRALLVYPRVCGGTSASVSGFHWYTGLSPRVRGNPRDPCGSPVRFWSIPACAGEPPPACRASTGTRVYPRVCGGTTTSQGFGTALTGLSPRVRGNLGTLARCLATERSIPACAGEPPPNCSALAVYRVYPRVCGGTGATNG